jgi:hypothetical protein
MVIIQINGCLVIAGFPESQTQRECLAVWLAPGAASDQRASELHAFLLPEGRVGLLDAFDGVVHVAGRGSTRLDSIAVHNGVDDGNVFSLYLPRKVSAACLVGAGDAGGTLQELAQVIKRADEKLVLCGICDGAV